MLGLFKAKRLRYEQAGEMLMRRLEEKSTLVVDKNLVADLGVGRRALYRIIYDMVRRERMFMLADDDDQMVLMTNSEFNRFMLRRSGLHDRPFLALTMEGADAETAGHKAISVEVAPEDLDAAAGSESVVARLAYSKSDRVALYCEESDGGVFMGATLGGASREDFWEIPAAALDSTLPATLYPTIPEPLGSASFPESDTTSSRLVRRLLKQNSSKRFANTLQEDGKSFAAAETDWLDLDMSGDGAELPSNRQNPPARWRDPWPVMEEAGYESE